MDQAEKLRDIFQNRSEAMLDTSQLSSRVITVTSGKGGVGKTNFTVSLAINFARDGKRVIIMDADYGLANVEVLFGIVPKYSLADVLSGDKKIEEVLTDGPFGIKFISGGSGLKGLANMSEKQLSYLINNFKYLDSISDIILVDTGAGISKSVVNFVKASTETIILTTPEPTSLTDAYALIKTVKEEKGNLPEFKIVVNRVDNVKEGSDIFEKLSRVSSRFLNIKLDYLGSVPFDYNLVKAVKKQQPVLISYPNTPFTKALEDINYRLNNDNKEGKEQDGIMNFMKRLVNIFGN